MQFVYLIQLYVTSEQRFTSRDKGNRNLFLLDAHVNYNKHTDMV